MYANIMSKVRRLDRACVRRGCSEVQLDCATGGVVIKYPPKLSNLRDMEFDNIDKAIVWAESIFI